MELILGFTALSLACSVIAKEVDLTPIEHDFSPETFANFNMSKKFKKFNLRDMESFGRRYAMWWYYYYGAHHIYSYNSNYRTCIFMTMTYLAAIPDIRRYFHIRYLYVNTLEYEVGYLTYDIVRKYQMLIEIYQVMYNKYYTMQDYWAAPTSYVFYMYRNSLELGIAISHLCNMLHEVDSKYYSQPLNHWDDYPEEGDEEALKRRNQSDRFKDAQADYEKRRAEEYKRRQRERRRQRKGMNFDSKITTPQRKPKKSFWPLHYGWSIEFW